MAKDGRGEIVSEAIRSAVEDGKTAQEVLRGAMAGPERIAATKVAPIRIKSGRKNYCSMKVAKNVVRIQFESEEDRAEIEAEIQALLEQIAARKKSR